MINSKEENMEYPIYYFQGNYKWLSNFWIESDGSHVEGEFQAAKALTPELREYYREKFLAGMPATAKCDGKYLTLRPDWEEVKIPIMYELVRQKFLDDPMLADLLVATSNTLLVEGNTWGDRFWGQTKLLNGQWSGRNELGKILMRVREELRKEKV